MSKSLESLAGRKALVTGASRGIGRAIALELAAAGADVAVNYNTSEAEAGAVAEQIRKLGRKAATYRASVEDAAALTAMVGKVIADFGGLDLLVNNAGIAPERKRVANTELEAVERMMRVNAFGPHLLCRLAIPYMRAAARSDIIMISSSGTRRNTSGFAPYNMAKAAMEALAFTLSKEEREAGLRVNIVCPGPTDTDMTRTVTKGSGGNLNLHASAPFGRIAKPEEIARLVAFLASDANSYATGQKIYVDGGGPLEPPLDA